MRVQMRGVAKRFGGTVALRGVDADLAHGEIHGLLGENGAGKTTLMNVLSGLYRADAGTIAIDGTPVVIRSPADALRHGIGMVHQHVELIQNMTALENVILGAEGARWWLPGHARRAEVDALARRFGFALELETPVRGLAAGVQQKIEILKALHRGVTVLILDEPTTMLTPQEVDALFVTLRTLAREGVSVVFITHKIKEILANCDRVTVMRDGGVVGTLDRAGASEARLVEMMIGERLTVASARPAAPSASETVLLDADGLSIVTERGAPAVRACGFRLGVGEVVGVAGVAGNGQRELAEGLAGLRPFTEGRLRLADRDVTRASVRARAAAGLVYIPEDRIHDGMLPGLSIAENVILGLHPFAFAGRWLFDRAAAHALARTAITDYGVVARDEHARAIALSGGNIQKLVVARAMALARLTRARVMVAMNPTRGLDVRATVLVRERLLGFAERGGAVLLLSEDLDELLQSCDRLLVMYRGAIVSDVARADFDAYRIGALMAGTA
jgi:simple sugar transport system ATP-binding protein